MITLIYQKAVEQREYHKKHEPYLFDSQVHHHSLYEQS